MLMRATGEELFNEHHVILERRSIRFRLLTSTWRKASEIKKFTHTGLLLCRSCVTTITVFVIIRGSAGVLGAGGRVGDCPTTDHD